MLRFLTYVLAFVPGVVFVYGFITIQKITGPSFATNPTKFVEVNLSYMDFVTVMFSGATLVLAGVALLVAIVAIFTYQGIKTEAARTIRNEVDRELQSLDKRIEREVGEEAEDKITKTIERAGRSGALDRALERALIAIGQGRTELTGELEKDFDPEDDGER